MENERERGHSERKGLGWEVYECNGPAATPSIFFDMTAQAPALRKHRCDCDIAAWLCCRGKKIYVPLSKFISLAGAILKGTLCCFSILQFSAYLSPVLSGLKACISSVSRLRARRALLWPSWRFTDCGWLDRKGCSLSLFQDYAYKWILIKKCQRIRGIYGYLWIVTTFYCHSHHLGR